MLPPTRIWCWTTIITPGWQVTIDGQRAPINRADYLLRAVRVPP